MNTSANNYRLESFLSSLLEEVVKADMSMHNKQVEAWKHFSEHKPRGPHINKDIDQDWISSRYLGLNEVKFKFHVRAIPPGFFRRLRQAFKYLFLKYEPQAFLPVRYELADAGNPDSIEVTVVVKQEEKGKMKITYEPDNELTKNLFLTSPFLSSKPAV